MIELLLYGLCVLAVVPCLAVLFVVLRAALGMQEVAQAERRAARGLCARCGYDMRGTPERCPECGMVVAGAGDVM